MSMMSLFSWNAVYFPLGLKYTYVAVTSILLLGPKSLTLSHTLCDLTSQLTQRGGLGLGGSVHEEARHCFPCFIQPTFK